MRQSISTAQPSDPVSSSDFPRPTPAKAGLRSDGIGLPFHQVMKDAVIRYYGSVKAAALSLEVDPSLMMREFDAGKFGRLEKADAEAKAFIAAAMQDAYGVLASPKARGFQLLREIDQRIAEIRQLIEMVA